VLERKEPLAVIFAGRKVIAFDSVRGREKKVLQPLRKFQDGKVPGLDDQL